MAFGFYRAFLIIFNVLFLIVGVTLVVLGLLFRTRWQTVREAFSASDGSGLSVVGAADTFVCGILVVGAVIVAAALVGVLGAAFELRVLLIPYTFILVIVVGAQLITIILIGVRANKASKLLEGTLKRSFMGYNESNADNKSKAVSRLFALYQCCGVKSGEEFDTNLAEGSAILWHPDTGKRNAAGISSPPQRPITCCKWIHQEHITDRTFKRARDCVFAPYGAPRSESSFKQGCHEPILKAIRYFNNVVIGVGLVIISTEIFLILVACCICYRENTAGYYKRATA